MIMDLVISGGCVLRPGGFDTEPLCIAGGSIAERCSGAARRIDATGKLVLPGLVDVHGDAFERQIMPRPGVTFDLGMAFAETDRQLVANGITTAFHGVTWSWEAGLRGTESTRAIVDAIEAVRPRLAADTFIHLRHETFNLDAEAELLDWIGSRRLDLLAFNDHMSDAIAARSRPHRLAEMVQRSGLTPDSFGSLAERTYARREEVPGSICRLAHACREAGIAMLSHDDRTPNQRGWYRDLGCRIAEFPVNESTAAAAAASGDGIVFGAPNVVRGRSHNTGYPRAADMVQRRMCSILTSDYYYPALLAAPFILEKRNAVPLESIWPLVSGNPARAVGLHDRGDLSPGKRADVILVEASGDRPRAAMTIATGRIVHCTDPLQLAP
jgi:alpha-D-ribose 1-methylphosphonate 5-triphosphate diphosphatase